MLGKVWKPQTFFIGSKKIMESHIDFHEWLNMFCLSSPKVFFKRCNICSWHEEAKTVPPNDEDNRAATMDYLSDSKSSCTKKVDVTLDKKLVQFQSSQLQVLMRLKPMDMIRILK